jgi:hypothetical protein
MERLENKLNALRVEISTAIVALIAKHNTDRIEVYDEFDDKPIIVDSYDDSMDTMTLDKIAVIDAENFDVTCSNGYDSTDTFSSKIISIDNLFEMYKWLVENEDDLFE